jgi:hypothetical protein
VIGESARVTHRAVPTQIPYAGVDLLGSDLLSFLPWFKDTVNQATVRPYFALGSPVSTTHPGGTPNTLYLLGGNWFVLIGAMIYSGIVLTLCWRARRKPGSAAVACFLLLFGTYLLGGYGIGTPTGTTTVAMIVAATGIWLGQASVPDPGQPPPTWTTRIGDKPTRRVPMV